MRRILSSLVLSLTLACASAQSAAQWAKKAQSSNSDPAYQVQCYTEAIRAGSNSVDLAGYRASRGIALIALKQYRPAIADLDTALSLLPNQPWMLQARARALAATGSYEPALSDLQKAIRFGSDPCFAYCLSAEIYALENQDSKAIQALQQAIGVNARYTTAWNQLVALYFKAKQYAQTLEVCEKILLLDPKSNLAYRFKAQVMEQKGDLDAAATAYEKALFFTCNDVASILGLGSIRLRQRRFEEAVQLFELALRRDANSAEARKLLAEATALLKPKQSAPDKPHPPSILSQYGGGMVLEPRAKPPVDYKNYMERMYGDIRLPPQTRLDTFIHHISNQGNQGSCVAQTVCTMKTIQELMETRQRYIFSPAYIYNQINHGKDEGSRIADALQLLREQGVCPMEDMPYRASDFHSGPSEQARLDAVNYRIDTFRQLYSLAQVKYELYLKRPVVAAFDVDEDFARLKGPEATWTRRGYQYPGEHYGHAMLIVGYDDERQAFRVVNSWGEDFGDKGFVWINYPLFEKVYSELYVAKDARTANDSLPGTAPPVASDQKDSPASRLPVSHSKSGWLFGFCVVLLCAIWRVKRKKSQPDPEVMQ